MEGFNALDAGPYIWTHIGMTLAQGWARDGIGSYRLRFPVGARETDDWEGGGRS
jgi:hypothetical protein